MEIRTNVYPGIKESHFNRFIIDKPFPEYYLNGNRIEAISKISFSQNPVFEMASIENRNIISVSPSR